MHIAIIGAGIMGRMLAWRLASQHQVTVYDADLSGQCSAAWAAGGMLSPTAESMRADSRLCTLASASLALWQQWFAAHGEQIGWQQKGSVLMAHRHDQAVLQHQVAKIRKVLRQHAADKVIQRDALSYYLPGEACVDARKVLAFLQQAPVKWVEQRIGALDDIDCEVDVCLDCRGYQAYSSFPTLRAVRGEIVYVHAPEVSILQPMRLIHPRYPIYIIPRGKGVYVLGASEIEAEDLSPMSVRTCMELLSAAYGMDSGFAEARIMEMVVGLRPALSVNHPEIQHTDNIIAVNGLYRHGFLLAPIMAQQVEEILYDCY